MAFIEITQCDGEKMFVNTEYIKTIKANHGGSAHVMVESAHWGASAVDVMEDYKTVKKLIEQAEAGSVEVVEENHAMNDCIHFKVCKMRCEPTCKAYERAVKIPLCGDTLYKIVPGMDDED